MEAWFSLSLLILRDSTLLEKYNDTMLEADMEKFYELQNNEIEVLNSPEKCLVCFQKHSSDSEGRMTRFVVHHLSYFPQRVGFVHDECHNKIHDSVNPLTQFVQYSDGDSRKFYGSFTEEIQEEQR